MENFLQEQSVDKGYRLLNIGATTLIGSAVGDDVDYMAAAWAGVLDFDKGYVIIDKSHYTRKLVEQSKKFVLCYPCAKIAELTMKLGTVSKNDDPNKLANANAQLIKLDGFDIPVIKNCVAYLQYEIISEPHNQETYDLFIGKCTRVVTDSRVYKDNHWVFDQAEDDLRTLHYVAGGHFFKIGNELVLPQYNE